MGRAAAGVSGKENVVSEKARTRKSPNGAAALDKRELLDVHTAFRSGVFTVRMPTALAGIDGKIADTLNDLIELHARLAAELGRLSRVVGEEGRTSQRTFLGAVGGGWATSVDSVNNLIVNLVHLARSVCPSSPHLCRFRCEWTQRRTPRWIACRTTGTP